MTSHELARRLLDMPDAPILTDGDLEPIAEVWEATLGTATTIYLETGEGPQASPMRRLDRVKEAAQKTVNAYEAYGFGRAVEHRVRLLRATLEARP
jgi:hypothetical protein